MDFSGRKLEITSKMEGRLFVVEGIDGSGKSTQIYLLKRWLESRKYRVFFTEWNSSELVRNSTKRAKKKNQLTPITFSLIHSSDFADRYEKLILPHLRAGYIVLADRYVYTAYARDIARGCNSDWVRNLYSFAVRPHRIFYFRVPLDISLERILRGRSELKFYEAGMDLNLAVDPRQSFEIFQGMVAEQYDQMAEEEGFVIIDATKPIEVQQAQVREIIAADLTGYHPPYHRVDESYLKSTSASGGEI